MTSNSGWRKSHDAQVRREETASLGVGHRRSGRNGARRRVRAGVWGGVARRCRSNLGGGRGGVWRSGVTREYCGQDQGWRECCTTVGVEVSSSEGERCSRRKGKAGLVASLLSAAVGCRCRGGRVLYFPFLFNFLFFISKERCTIF